MSTLAKAIRFDRGTLELAPHAPETTHSLWDPRTETRRVAAHRFGDLVRAAEERGERIDGDLRLGWFPRVRDATALGLSAYFCHRDQTNRRMAITRFAAWRSER